MVLALALAFALVPIARAEPFPRPQTLEPQVRFWRSIFAEHSKHQIVLHDAVELDKVYRVLDFRSNVGELSDVELARLEREETERALDDLRATFRRLAEAGERPEGLSADDRRVWQLFKDDPSPERFAAAAGEKRLRSQRGLRERFGDGLRTARRYFPEMERIFREEGLPAELTRLPLIESCFDVNAYSKVGAAGIWQFMPRTGRLFAMKVGDLVDERRDPIASTRGAARYLKEMYDDLGAWPLAITGWNHGPAGVARAVGALDTTDIGVIVRRYQGSAFGFASRNFYAEFLAALDVERHEKQYFGEQGGEPPLREREHLVDRPLGIQQAARMAGTDTKTLATLNPALLDPVVEGRRPIPRGYRLRLPAESADGFATRLAEVADDGEVAPRVLAVRPSHLAVRGTRERVTTTHTVASGQTLSHIAKRYRVTVASLRTANRIKGRLRPGQVLRIPRA
ncbi:MAG: transglycosylase SLT domain-containing protein [Candidatus Binatia bacterium]